MSFEDTRRRCIIQKLDFENCIVTNFKTTTRGRKKLRARITREYQYSEAPKEESTSTENPRSSSPVLLKKVSRNVAIAKRKKINSPDRSKVDDESCTPGSPVFKTQKKPKTWNSSQDIVNVLGRLVTVDASDSQGSSSSFQIDEFTQESKQSVKISSVESPTPKTDTSNDETNNCFPCTPTPNYESPKPVRKNYKKKGLLGRLYNLQKKQASEKLLFQHQNRRSWGNSMRISVDSFWKEEFNYYLKCRSSGADMETIFMIADSRWVPNLKNVKEGSVVELHPPWLKVVDGSVMTVLNVICLNVLEETEEPLRQKKTFEEVSTDRFESDQKPFIESLFSSWSSGFLC